VVEISLALRFGKQQHSKSVVLPGVDTSRFGTVTVEVVPFG
jgi:hypothetical protein